MTIEPAAFARQALVAMEASEGRRRRRKRDTEPDRIGLELKRTLLERLAAEAPAPDTLEAWLLETTWRAAGAGATRAMCVEILDEYRAAVASPAFREWLDRGAPSDDRAEAAPPACDIR